MKKLWRQQQADLLRIQALFLNIRGQAMDDVRDILPVDDRLDRNRIEHDVAHDRVRAERTAQLVAVITELGVTGDNAWPTIEALASVLASAYMGASGFPIVEQLREEMTSWVLLEDRAVGVAAANGIAQILEP